MIARDGQKMSQLAEIADKPLAFTEMLNWLQLSTEPQQDAFKSQGNPYRTWSAHSSPRRAVNLTISANCRETPTIISGNPNLFRRIGRWIRISASLSRPRLNEAAMHRRPGDLHRSPYQSRGCSFAPRGSAVASHRPGASERTCFLDSFSG